ncbi:MAG: hypothetical protein K2W82_06730 [Candidatus Obscuribacterales bacterium]|nr:hypothetical protein [Candidatus Obscuribacterales bacterium]
MKNQALVSVIYRAPALRHKREDRGSLTRLKERLANPSSRPDPGFIQQIVAELTYFISQLFISRSNKLSTPMCDNYGHCIQGQQWKSTGIYCRDCGAQVTAPDQLRKASPR